jgi:hypothetical protein
MCVSVCLCVCVSVCLSLCALGRCVLVNVRLVSESACKRGVEWHVCELQLTLTCIALAMVIIL